MAWGSMIHLQENTSGFSKGLTWIKHSNKITRRKNSKIFEKWPLHSSAERIFIDILVDQVQA
jgi:hypothetical protein